MRATRFRIRSISFGALLLSVAAIAEAAVSPTTITLSAPTSATVGTSVTATASLNSQASPTGVLTFYDGTNSLGTAAINKGAAALMFALQSAGAHSIKAVYAGSALSASATSPVSTVTALPASASVSLSIPATASIGTTVTETATITTSGVPNGSVAFYDGTTVVGSAAVSGNSAVFKFTPTTTGSHSIKAVFSGNPSVLSGSSPTVSMAVSAMPASVALTVASAGAVGTPIQVTAKVSVASGAAPAGSVSFHDSGAAIGLATLSGGTAALTFTPNTKGTHSISASFVGNATTQAATSPNYTVVVAGVTPVVKLSAPSTALVGVPQSLGGTIGFTAGAPSSGTFTLTDNGSVASTGSVAPSGVFTLSWTAKSVASHALVLSYSGDGTKYAQAAATPVSVVASMTTATVSAPTTIPAIPQAGSSVTISVNVSGYNPTGTVTFKDGVNTLGTANVTSGSASLSTVFPAAGNRTITATYGGDANNKAGSSSRTVSVSLKPATVVLSASNLSVSANPLGAIFLSAKVSNSQLTGTVVFTVNGAQVPTTTPASIGNSGIAGASFPDATAGTYSVVATYSGDASSASAVSNTVTVTVTKPTKGPKTGNGINYNGGDVMASGMNVYFIWYGDWSTTQAVALMPKFVSSLSGSPYWHIMTTYADALHGNVNDSVTYLGSTVDNYSQTKSIDDVGVATIVQTALKNGTLPTDPNGIYFVMGGKDIKETTGYGTVYCGWHSSMAIKGIDVAYGYVGNPQQAPAQCGAQANPIPPHADNGVSDAVANILAHEMAEAATDKDLTAWYVSDRSSKVAGMENGDLCAWNWITVTATPTPANALYNVQLGTDYWLLQGIWLNANGGLCALSY